MQRKLILRKLGQNRQLAVNMHLLLLFAGQTLRNLLQLCVCRQHLLFKVIRTVSANRAATVLRAHIMQLHHVLRYIKRHTQLFCLIAFIGQGITAQHAKTGGRIRIAQIRFTLQVQLLPVNQSVKTADADKVFVRAYQAVQLQAVLLACQAQLTAERRQVHFTTKALLAVLIHINQSELA